MASTYYILFLFLSIVLLIMGILYLSKKGSYYRKLAEKKSEKSVRNLGIVFVILGSLLLVVSIYELFIAI